MTTITIIIPAYNAAVTLPETLSSALAQTWSDIEIIVIDDGSTDSTSEVVARFAARDSRVRGVGQANAGVAEARNHGLRLARGDFIAPLDADDLWHPEKLARQVGRLRRSGTHAGMAYCWSTDVDDSSTIIHHRIALDRWEGDIYAPLIYANFIGNGSVPLINRELLAEIGGWDGSLRDADAQGCEDWQLYLRIARRAQVVLVPGFLVGYRRSAGAMSRNIRSMCRSYRLVMAEARRDRPDLPEWLFRWSRGAFHMYVAELLFEAGDTTAALNAAGLGIWNDPAWLCRHSTRRKAAQALRRLTKPGMFASQPSISPLPYPLGRQFCELAPEPHAEAPEGSVMRRREASIDALVQRGLATASPGGVFEPPRLRR